MLKLKEGERGRWKEKIDPPRESFVIGVRNRKEANRNRENIGSGLHTGGIPVTCTESILGKSLRIEGQSTGLAAFFGFLA
jgi:hypothetical protein